MNNNNTSLDTNQLSYEDFNRELIEINHQLMAFCDKYNVRTGLDAQWNKGHYVIAQDISALCADRENLLGLSFSSGRAEQS